MIQTVFNGMLAILLAKFVLNDVPHMLNVDIDTLIDKAIEKKREREQLYRDFARTPGGDVAKLQAEADKLDTEYHSIMRRILDMAAKMEPGSPKLAEVDRRLKYL